jgi:hypothetical protein
MTYTLESLSSGYVRAMLTEDEPSSDNSLFKHPILQVLNVKKIMNPNSEDERYRFLCHFSLFSISLSSIYLSLFSSQFSSLFSIIFCTTLSSLYIYLSLSISRLTLTNHTHSLPDLSYLMEFTLCKVRSISHTLVNQLVQLFN